MAVDRCGRDLRFATAADLVKKAALVKKADLSWIGGVPQAGRVDAVGYQFGIGAWSDRSRAVLRDAAVDPQRLVAI